MADNKRIAKNAAMLWLRMLLSIVVSIYTSRVVLQTLGVEDYGVYNVVGGVIAMFGFLNASMAGATSRFLNVEMGKGNASRLGEVFSSALIIHLGLALLVLVLAETVGLWFLTHKLVIPAERMFAAHCVYQCTIFTMVVGFTQVPYDATIIAHERMDVYAYIELANVFMKLGIVYLLVIGSWDKLILYGVLVMAVAFLVAMMYRVYCLRHFPESHFRWVWQPALLRPMLSFSGWDLYGNMSVSARVQGTSFLQNIFFGARINAAAGIAATVQGILYGFASNVITAFRPQIIQSFAAGNMSQVRQLMSLAIKFSLALFMLISIPIFMEADYVLHLWLGVVPEYTVEFFRLIILANIFTLLHTVLIIPIHASGKVKRMSILTGSLFFASLLPMYILFRFGASPAAAYWVYMATILLVLFVDCWLVRYQICVERIGQVLADNLLRNICIIGVVYGIVAYVQTIFEPSFLRLLLVCALVVTIYTSLFSLVLLNKHTRRMLWDKILYKLRKN